MPADHTPRRGPDLTSSSGPALLSDLFKTCKRGAADIEELRNSKSGTLCCFLRTTSENPKILKPGTHEDSLPAGGHPWPVGISTRWVRSGGFSDAARHRLTSSRPPPPGFAWRTPGTRINRATQKPPESAQNCRTCVTWHGCRARFRFWRAYRYAVRRPAYSSHLARLS